MVIDCFTKKLVEPDIVKKDIIYKISIKKSGPKSASIMGLGFY